MMLSTIVAPYGTGEQPTSMEEDSTRAFNRFLDLITPTEFSKLLRTRVEHLLKTWPPRVDSAAGTSSSIASTLDNASPPTIESIQAFAAFFRTQDAPGPSPVHLPAATSLSILHHHLLALQTLLSFLSGRELKEIVLSRLGESGKDRAAAVHGLMDVMRSTRDDGLGELVEGGFGIGVEARENRREENGQDKQTNTAIAPELAPATIKQVHKRKQGASSHERVESDDYEDGQPPKKRQRITESDEEFVTNIHPAPQSLAQSSPTPLSVYTHPSPPACSSLVLLTSTESRPIPPDVDPHSISPLSNAETTQKACTDVLCQVTLNPLFVSERHAGSNSSHEELNDVEMGGPKDSKKIQRDSERAEHEEEDEVGALIEGEKEPTYGLPPIVPPKPGALPVVAWTLPTTKSPILSGPSVSLGSKSPGREEREQDGGKDTAPCLRTAADMSLGRLEQGALGRMSPVANAKIVDGAGEEAPNNLISRTSEGDTAFAASSCSMSLDSSSGSARTPSPIPRPQFSRSRSSSFHESDAEDRASPPGPTLRAVDWASGVTPMPIQAGVVYRGDVLEDAACENSITLRDGTVFNLDADLGGVGKSPSFPKSLAEVISGRGSMGAKDDAECWDNCGEQIQDFGTEDEASGTPRSRLASTKGGSETPQKLYIRLPPRPKSKAVDTGIVTPPEAGASGPVSLARSPSLNVSSAVEKESSHVQCGGPDAVTESPDGPTSSKPGKKADSHGSSTEDAKVQPKGVSSVNPSATAQSASYPSSQADGKPHAQGAAGSRNQSPAIYPGGHHPHPHQHHRANYAHPQAYPGPWFGAMFYVPFPGLPHPGGPPRPPLPKMQIATTASSKSAMGVSASRGAEDSKGPNTSTGPAPGPSKPDVTPQGSKKAQKRKSSAEHPEAGGPSTRMSPPAVEPDPHMTYTDEVGVKESGKIKRRCNNCQGIQAPSWRKSKLNVGKILCNKCGIYESTHMTPRPLKTRPRRSLPDPNGEVGTAKKRKSPKKAVPE